MRGPLVVLVFGALLLSGCTADQGSPGAHQDPADDQDTTVEAPQWSIGDHWSYDAPTGAFTLVVTGDERSDWIVEATQPGIALFHALYDLSYMGPVRKSDLAGSQDGERVKFFDFPLEDGKQWTTQWDGQTVSITTTMEDDGTFRFESTADGGPHSEYVYDTQARFFKEVTFFSGGPDGDDWWMRLSSSGTDFTGTIHRYELGLTHTFIHDTADSGLYDLVIDEKWNELSFISVLVCNDSPAGEILVGVNTPERAEDPLPMTPVLNEPEEGHSIDCRTTPVAHRSWVMENTGGTWELGFLVGAPEGVAHLFISERAHHEVPFP